MSKLLANQISNYNDNGPVEAKDGINVANGKPFQVAGASGTSGDYLKSTGSSVAWTTFPSIPAAQVNADWNATSGVEQILNKPTLAAVATSGQYGDLSGLPTIPAAQVQSDWNTSNTSSVSFIQNKPTLFSGAYNDLTGKPTIPTNLSDLSDVSSTAPNNNEVLKWNGSNWAPAADGGGGSYGNNDVDTHLNVSGASSGQILSWNGSDYAWVADQTGGGGGSTTFTGLTDTPANFTSQAGKYLRVNAGATALEYVTLPVDPDTNTTYSQSSVADGSNVKLRLTDSGSTNDDILLTAGTNITFTSVTSGGFTINHTGSAVASVVTDDNAPSSPSDGDLWWKSDEGRLKVYYQDADSAQWVDANPPLSPPSTVGGTMNAHIIPDTNAAYDLGNAEYKIRHLFLSDNTVYFQGDFLKVAQHNSGGSAQSASYLIPLAKLKDALNASADYEAFKTAILAITDA